MTPFGFAVTTFARTLMPTWKVFLARTRALKFGEVFTALDLNCMAAVYNLINVDFARPLVTVFFRAPKLALMATFKFLLAWSLASDLSSEFMAFHSCSVVAR